MPNPSAGEDVFYMCCTERFTCACQLDDDPSVDSGVIAFFLILPFQILLSFEEQ
ncbi:MAG: hypothetical protein OXC40_00575 [Proteobacteria bacterium]|nr:hypothetical protein [Pseudomonadota bacterium]